MQARKHILIGAFIAGVIAGGVYYHQKTDEVRIEAGESADKTETSWIAGDSEESIKKRIRDLSAQAPLVRFEYLQAELGHPSPLIRHQALLAMKYDVSPEATVYLYDRAIHDPSPDIRDLALQQAVQKQPDRALSLVIAALGDESQTVRDTAMMKLAEIAPPDLTDLIIERCEEENRDPRRGEILALGKVGGDRAIEFLVSVVLRHSPVSGIAIHALAKLGNTTLTFIDRLDPGKMDREQIMYVCLLLEEIRSDDALLRMDQWRRVRPGVGSRSVQELTDQPGNKNQKAHDGGKRDRNEEKSSEDKSYEAAEGPEQEKEQTE